MITEDFYRALEDRFRGTREDIKARQKVYLPLIEVLQSRCEKPGVDVGSGRAEWLELLTEHGFLAVGVDLNSDFAALGKELGLTINNADLNQFLAEQPDEAFSFVSAFHVVEHLGFEKLLEFLKMAHRVLDDQGFLLLETPNPVNLTVGANTFYTDPTHDRPLPPGLLSFATEFAGFHSPVIVPVNRHLLFNPLVALQQGVTGSTAVNRVVELLNNTLMAAPDYAVIAFKKTDDHFVKTAQSLIAEQALKFSEEKAVDIVALEGKASEAHHEALNAQQMAIQTTERTARVERTLQAQIDGLRASLSMSDSHIQQVEQNFFFRISQSFRGTGRFKVLVRPKRALKFALSRTGQYVSRRPKLKVALSRLLSPVPSLRVKLAHLSRTADAFGTRHGSLVVERKDLLGNEARKVHEDLLAEIRAANQSGVNARRDTK